MDGFDELTLKSFYLLCRTHQINPNELILIDEAFNSLEDVDLDLRPSGNRLELIGKYNGYTTFIDWKNNAYHKIEIHSRTKTLTEISFTTKEFHNCWNYRDLLTWVPKGLTDEMMDIPCLYQRQMIDSKTEERLNLIISFLHFPKSKS